jgi:hypothetical protein
MSYLLGLFFVSATWAGYPAGPVEYVGNGKSDIVHCLNQQGGNRQFCKAGWGPAFKPYEKLKIFAPETYGAALFISDSTQTPFGQLRATKVLKRLAGTLYEKWGIIPELVFVLDWSRHPDCWKDGVLAVRLEVKAGERTIGYVRPTDEGAAEMDYHFPLTASSGEQSWRVVGPADELASRVSWKDSSSLALQTEFDFVSPQASVKFPFSATPLKPVCKLEMANVQIILSRTGTEAALKQMQSEARLLSENLMTEALSYAFQKQGRSAVQCVLTKQAEEMKRAENISSTESVTKLSERAQGAFEQSLLLTSNVTGIVGEDLLPEFEKNRADWKRACTGTATLISEQSDVQDPAVRRYLEKKSQLRDLLEDAWTLSVLLTAINKDNRKLQWMIDSTVTYQLSTED